MPRTPKEKVEKVCAECGATFRTKYPNRQRFCPGSKCRSAHWEKQHRVEDKEAFAREVIRKYERERKARWRSRRKVGQAEVQST